jgi:gamma-polyglutamate biosynthesis protein CapA
MHIRQNILLLIIFFIIGSLAGPVFFNRASDHTQQLELASNIVPPVYVAEDDPGDDVGLEKTPNQILFVGDVMLGRNVEFLMGKHGHDYPYRGLNLHEEFDDFYLVGNFESAIALNHIRTKSYTMLFSMNKLTLPATRNFGFTHFSLANNHTFDFGSDSFKNTVDVLKEFGFSTFGHPHDVTQAEISYLTIDNHQIALIGFNALAEIPTEVEISDALVTASMRSDFQIVSIHWGNEYINISNETQRLLAKQFVEAGADLVVGHHPHVVQEVELIDGVLVFYSLGNFIFDQYFSDNVQNGLLLRVVFAESSPPLVDIIPVTSVGKLSQPRMMGENETKQFLLALAKRSNDKLSTGIESGTLPLWPEVATSVKIAIMR